MATMTFERQMADEAAPESPKVQMTRVIRASRQRVFDAWTRPEFIRQWFGPGNMAATEASTDLRVGGGYRIEMTGPSCEEKPEETDISRTTVVTGAYRKVVPHELLEFTWTGSWHPEEETLVTVALRDVEGGTEMTLTHERFLTEEAAGRHRMGWTSTLSKLEEFAQQ